jgi:hypothetical protein
MLDWNFNFFSTVMSDWKFFPLFSSVMLDWTKKKLSFSFLFFSRQGGLAHIELIHAKKNSKLHHHANYNSV